MYGMAWGGNKRSKEMKTNKQTYIHQILKLTKEQRKIWEIEAIRHDFPVDTFLPSNKYIYKEIREKKKE